MATLPTSSRIVIIGGGVMGLFTAWECASKGEKDIVILEARKFLGAGATQKAAGGVRTQFTTAPNIHFSKYSQAFYRNRFAKEINPDFEYLPYGYLFIARTREKLDALDRSLALQLKYGVEGVKRLKPGEIKEIHPDYFTDDVLGANYTPDDGFIDPGDIVNGLDTSLRRMGISIFTEIEVQSIEFQADFLHKVSTSRGTILAEKVLVATGSWSGELLSRCGIDVPIQPYRRTLYMSTPLPWFPKKSPFTFDVASGTHFRPESGGINFLKINPDEPPSHNEEPDWDFLDNIIPDLIHIMPRLEDMGVKDAWAGPYAMTPDHNAILGELPVPGGYRGVYLASGFSGHGLMHSPAVACAMSELILDGKTSTLDIHAYRPSRFIEHDEIHEAAVF